MKRDNTIVALILTGGILPMILYAGVITHASIPQVDEVIRLIPLLDQTMVVITAFVIKPLYMLISLALVWILRGSRTHVITTLRWGLLSFFIGEAFCAINYLIFRDKSIFSEFLHSYGMVVAFGFIGYAFLEGLDRNIIQYSNQNKRCSFISMCSECVKSQETTCRIRQLFQLMTLILGFMVFIPLLAEIRETSYLSYIYGTVYNYIRLKAHLLFEIRYCPSVALVLFIVAFIDLHFSKAKQIPDLARVFVSAGVGALGFSIFRLFLNSVFSQNLAWAASWEEITEFCMITTIAYVIWLFRKSLITPAG